MPSVLMGDERYIDQVRAIPGLLAYWPLGDGGATFQDLGPNGFTGTFKGTIDAKGQPWDGGYYADFSAGFADVYSAALLAAFDPTEFSVNMYIKPDSFNIASDQYIMHWYVDASNYVRVQVAPNGGLNAIWRAGAVTESIPIGAACWPSNWVMLTFSVSKSNNRIRLMVNSEYNAFNADTAAGTWAGSFASNLCGFAGYRGSTFTLSYLGGLANVAVYNNEITEAQARTLLLKPLPVLTGIGDSIMQYTSRSSWIQGAAQSRGYRVVNHGYSGTSIMGGGAYDMTAQAAAAASDGASVIILQHGINDADDAGITAKYQANIAALQASNSAAKIYGMGILNNTGATAGWRSTNNARIEAACNSAGIPFWNTDGWIDPATDTADGVHPNSSGAAKIVTQILDLLDGYFTLPQYMRTAPPTVIEALDAVTNWSAFSSCTRAVNNAEYVDGGASIKVTSAVGSVGDIRYTPAVALDLSAAQQVVMYIYIHNAVSDLSASSSILMRFFTDGAYTAYWTYTLPVGNYTAGRWLRVACPVGKFTATGGASSWASITRVQLRFTAASGIAASVSFDGLAYVTGSKAGVMFRFDDGPVAQYNSVFPMLRAHNFPATLYIPSSYPGTAGYVTWANLVEMQAAGWTIGNHSTSHGDLTLLSQADQRTELETCDAALTAQGLTGGKYHAYPLGNWNADTLAAMALAGMLTGHDNYAPSSLHNYVPPLDWYLIGSAATDNTTTVATLTGYIDDAIAGGSVVCFHFHDIGGAGDMSLADLTTLVNYVVARKTQIYPLTIDHLYRLNSGAVDIPIIY